MHTYGVPVMGGGPVVTVIVFAAMQPDGNVYVIVTVPGASAVIRPVTEPMDATAGALLVQVPPAVALVYVVDDPAHMPAVPVTGAIALTVIVLLTEQVPIE